MPTECGRQDVDVVEALMSVTMDVSRAHLLLSGTLDWVPGPVQPSTHEALDILDRAVKMLRDIAVTVDGHGEGGSGG